LRLFQYAKTPEAFLNLSLEKIHQGVVAGVDEAGRGPLAGPVVAAAVVLPAKGIPRGIDDSKKMSSEEREVLFERICKRAHVGVGIASVEEIDRLNILGATKLAMQRAVAALSIVPDVVMVDGNQPPALSCKTVTVVGGDAISLSIAAASIVAKVTRDRIMKSLADEHPGYGWDSNAGYGTRKHYQGMQALGITAHHRRSFGPVKAMLSDQPVQWGVAIDAAKESA
jgi:ribonuclease HII